MCVLLFFSMPMLDSLKMVQEQVAELEAKLAKLTAEFNAANTDKQEVNRASTFQVRYGG